MEVLSAENNISIGDGSSMDGDISIGDTISIDNNDDLWDQFNNFNTEDGVGDTKPSELNEDLQEEYGCSNCKTFTLMYKDGQHICGVCGIVQHKRLSHEAEYRFYGDSDNKSSNPERVGLPTNYMLPESSLGTLIKHRAYDNNSIKRMVQYNSWHQMPYKERSLYKICCRIANRSKMNGLPTIIIERAKEFYNTIRDVNISRGDNRDGIIAACVYFACKDENVPRSSKEIAGYFNIKLQDMTRGIKKFRDNWRLANNTDDILKSDSSNPIDFIERYCSNLPIDVNIKHISEFIAIKSIFCNLVNDNTSPSIAAGAIFLACTVTNQNITKKQVAEACKTSEVTISKCFKKLNNRKLDLLPKQIKLDYNIK
jgi:transcription initiation factor TFIIB|tara:strand:+ start:2175 stop:3281 length:1107 start_codon:yes stop_codon:yes gene_type:complete